jgi:hypothetical protein
VAETFALRSNLLNVRVIIFAVFAAGAANGQENFHVELTLAAWRAGVEGSVQSGGLPIALRGDLALEDTWTFYGKLVFKPARRQRINVEGIPYDFSGLNTLSRTITYQGRTYSIQDTVGSEASLTYFFGGYQFDLISHSLGHLGLEAGGAYLSASGTIHSMTTGVSATRTQTIGLPLAGAEFRVFLIPRVLNVNGEVKGMSIGGYGEYFQASVNAGAGFSRFSFQVGYQYLNADIHENRAVNPAGIAPVISGPVFSVQLRDR